LSGPECRLGRAGSFVSRVLRLRPAALIGPPFIGAHLNRLTAFQAQCAPLRKNPVSNAIIAITTNNSISVLPANPRRASLLVGGQTTSLERNRVDIAFPEGRPIRCALWMLLSSL